MPVVSEEWLRGALRCPCGHALAWDPPRCTAAGCAGAAGFPVVDGQAVLVDFEASVLDRATIEASGGASPVRRGARLRNRIRRVAYGQNGVAEGNAGRLLGALPPGAVLLIVGAGEEGVGVGRLRAAPGLLLVGFDIYASPCTQFVADAHAIPLAAGSVDAVWVQAVLEHVLDPWRVAAEIHRVLRPGGLVYAETPFMQQVHEGAYDFTRFTESGHRWLFRGFECLGSGPVGGLGTALTWSIRSLMTGLVRNAKLGEALTLPFFWLRLLDGLAAAQANADGASGTWFLGRRAPAPITPKAAVGFYPSRR